MIYIGTSGYSYPKWRRVLYPEGLPQTKWLAFYAEHFNTVEINATFYRSFSTKTYAKWEVNVPEDFAFTLKGSKTITHVKRLKDVEGDIVNFFAPLEPLMPKVSCILWQFPPSFKYEAASKKKLEKFFKALPRVCRHACEMRHASWADESVYELFKTYSIGWVTGDAAPFLTQPRTTTDFSYIRLHGPEQLYASSYTDEQLKAWAEHIMQYAKLGDVYCYFNNTMVGAALQNIATIKSFLDDFLLR
jgi:uncharacterized protein YecE (DUF72 family)